MLCRDTSIVKHDDAETVVKALRCRCWHCEQCAPIRKEDLKGLARRGKPNRFLTLTVNPSVGESPTERAQGLYRAWKLIRERARRQLGIKHITFLAIFEKTKKGEPHLHILVRGAWLSQKWLSAQMADIMEAPIVDIRHCDNPGRASAYVAKYIGKDPIRWEGCKRYWRSQDYELPEDRAKRESFAPTGTWERKTMRIGAYVHMKEHSGWSSRWVDTWTCILKPPDRGGGERASC